MWMRLVFFSLLTSTLWAAEPTVLSSVGTATVRAEPEKAEFLLSVVAYAEDADRAAAENARKTRALIERLEERLGPETEIRTRDYALHPNRKYSKRGPEQVTGYSVTNSVHVTVPKVETLGAILDLATAAGADEVMAVQFAVKDAGSLKRRAWIQATREARRNADAMAEALGMEVTRVVSLDDPVALNPDRLYAFGSVTETVRVGGGTPIRAGEVTQHASVVLTVEAATAGASSTK